VKISIRIFTPILFFFFQHDDGGNRFLRDRKINDSKRFFLFSLKCFRNINYCSIEYASLSLFLLSKETQLSLRPKGLRYCFFSVIIYKEKNSSETNMTELDMLLSQLGVDFTNILSKAFMLADPKSAKNTVKP